VASDQYTATQKSVLTSHVHADQGCCTPCCPPRARVQLFWTFTPPIFAELNACSVPSATLREDPFADGGSTDASADVTGDAAVDAGERDSSHGAESECTRK
jgi:hypothetical protein